MPSRNYKEDGSHDRHKGMAFWADVYGCHEFAEAAAQMVGEIERAMTGMDPPFPCELLIVKIRRLLVELLDFNAGTEIGSHEGAVQKSLEIEEALHALMRLFMDNR